MTITMKRLPLVVALIEVGVVTPDPRPEPASCAMWRVIYPKGK